MAFESPPVAGKIDGLKEVTWFACHIDLRAQRGALANAIRLVIRHSKGVKRLNAGTEQLKNLLLYGPPQVWH